MAVVAGGNEIELDIADEMISSLLERSYISSKSIQILLQLAHQILPGMQERKGN